MPCSTADLCTAPANRTALTSPRRISDLRSPTPAPLCRRHPSGTSRERGEDVMAKHLQDSDASILNSVSALSLGVYISSLCAFASLRLCVYFPSWLLALQHGAMSMDHHRTRLHDPCNLRTVFPPGIPTKDRARLRRHGNAPLKYINIGLRLDNKGIIFIS